MLLFIAIPGILMAIVGIGCFFPPIMKVVANRRKVMIIVSKIKKETIDN